MAVYSTHNAGPVVILQPPSGSDPARIASAVAAVKAIPTLYAVDVQQVAPVRPLVLWGTLGGLALAGFLLGRWTA